MFPPFELLVSTYCSRSCLGPWALVWNSCGKLAWTLKWKWAITRANEVSLLCFKIHAIKINHYITPIWTTCFSCFERGFFFSSLFLVFSWLLKNHLRHSYFKMCILWLYFFGGHASIISLVKDPVKENLITKLQTDKKETT